MSKRLLISFGLVVAGATALIMPLVGEFMSLALNKVVLLPLWFCGAPLIGAGLLYSFDMWATGAVLGMLLQVGFVI